jgi:hypothetical protein
VVRGMWWVPLATAVVLSLVVFLLHFWHQRRQLDEAKAYRARFVQLVAQLETVTTTVNRLEAHVRSIKEPKLLDYYEGTLRILETLLGAVRKLPPFGSDTGSLESAFYLVKDCRHRVGRTQQAFQDSMRGREVKLEELYGHGKKSIDQTGCYFCSRPVISSRFSKVKVKIDGDVREVMSCKICREELETTKKVKVLYFMKDGRPVHWSQMPDYHPSEDFWNINKRDAIRKTRKLELVHTNPDPKRLD